MTLSATTEVFHSDLLVQTSMNHDNDIEGTGAWWPNCPPGGSTGKHQMGIAVGRLLKGKAMAFPRGVLLPSVRVGRLYSTCCAHCHGIPRVRKYLDNRLWGRSDIMTFDLAIGEGDARLSIRSTGDYGVTQ